jgi:hypothetical protein
MDMKVLNTIGLTLDFIGAVILFIYAKITVGATTPVDQDYRASLWWSYAGYGSIAVGCLLQLIGSLYPVF